MLILRVHQGRVGGVKLFRGRSEYLLPGHFHFEEIERVIELIRKGLRTTARIEEKKIGIWDPEARGPLLKLIAALALVALLWFLFFKLEFSAR
ncbi:MAG: hypothetical protein HY706_15725 [Candidatus Hydrogenedentes bacterium]|nr:hypothetical protein [Candidatus Hydrogenedentota bacterium]